MKILHINANYITTKLHDEMIQRLNERGVENSVFVPTYDMKRSIIEEKDYVVVTECFKKNDRFLFDYKQKKIFKSVDKEFNLLDFDFLHAYTLFTDGNLALSLKRKYNIPYVVAVRNTDVNVFFKYMIHLRNRGIEILSEAEYVFFLSPAYKQYCIENYIPEKDKKRISDKSHIIPNGINDFWLNNKVEKAKKTIKETEFNLLYVGKINKNKNIETTLKVVNQLNKIGYKVKYNIVGPIEDENIFKKIKSNKFTAYYPQMTKKELLNIYRENDIFIMPSLTETFGLVYVEAMSQGLPVIYSKGQGFDGYFSDGKVGFSVNPLDVKSIVQSVIKILKNYSSISDEAVISAKKFDWQCIIEIYLQIYMQIVKEEKV